ncbi:2,3-diphosphoglycerate synthetase [Candidatus Bipolaricaulota bacterium]|nr:2,3-diphosphoglycerate synthetase [Candidatus Bipolaricaulota bacterium]
MKPKALPKPRAIALVDGEHYLPVVKWALASLEKDYAVVGAVFLGGTEKVGSEEDLANLGVPVVHGKTIAASVREAVARFAPEVALDLSDEPVVGYRERFEMASLFLFLGVRYVGKDFAFTPPKLVKTSLPAISVVGTGKRTGKTAIAGHAARVLKGKHRVGIVTMGRGGPAEPEVLHGEELDLGVEELIRYADQGFHAASGCFGHAYMTQVLVIGCRRCGGGMSGGEPFVSNVVEGAKLAEEFGLDIVIFDGSGATAPPIEVDRQVLIVGAHQPVDYVRGYFGPYRILRSHAVVITGCEPPLADEAKVDAMEAAVREVSPDVPVFRTVFRPRPVREVDGARAFLAVTAPAAVLPRLVEHLEERYRCRVVGASPHLSNRPKLRQDLAAAGDFDVLLAELKAAGVDVAARTALACGKDVVFVDNEPVAPNIEELDQCLERLAVEAVQAKRGAAFHA